MSPQLIIILPFIWIDAKDGLSRFTVMEQSGSYLDGDASDGSGLIDKSLYMKPSGFFPRNLEKMQQRQMQRSSYMQGQEVTIAYSHKYAQRILFFNLVPYLQLLSFHLPKAL